MAGLIFAISLLSILATVGFLFAWMVHLASVPEHENKQNQSVTPEELSPSTVRVDRP